MTVDLTKLRAVAEGGPADEVVGATRGYFAAVLAQLEEQRRALLFPQRMPALTHKAPEVLRS